MNSKISLTAAECENLRWTVIETTPLYRRSVGYGTHPVTGLPIEVLRTEFLADEDIQALNAEERAARDSKPWSAGAGSDKGDNVPLIRVARIPLNKLFSEVTPHMQRGDKDFLRWWLDRPENAPFRTKSGRL